MDSCDRASVDRMRNVGTNELGQPIGAALPNWTPPPRLMRECLVGTYCQLQPLALRHAAELFDANRVDRVGRMWTYLAYGPFGTFESYSDWLAGVSPSADPLFFAVVDAATG